MKVQQASRQEISLLRDGTAATEGHSFHAAAATLHQHSTPEWRMGDSDLGGYLTSLGLGLPKDQLLLQKVTSTTYHGMASPDERDY